MTDTWKIGLGALAFVGICCAAFWSEGGLSFDSDTTVERPATADSQALVDALAEAYRVQKVCYGWAFTGNSPDSYQTEPTDVGSNFGVGEHVRQHEAECTSSVLLEVEVTYTSASSEQEDSAYLMVTTTGLDVDDFALEAELRDRFGVTEQALIDEPVDTLGQAVLALPLLVSERGLATPLPTPSAAAGAADELGSAGWDFWRSWRLWILTTLGLLAVAAGLVAIGFAMRRNKSPAGG